MPLLETINRMLLPLKRSISIMVAKALITSVIDKKNTIQLVQIDLGNNQAASDIERVQNFGFTSNPKNLAQAIVIALGGSRDHMVVIAVDDSNFRPSVGEGDSAMYNSDGMLLELRGKETLVGDGKHSEPANPLDGVMTGQAIDSLLGIPMGSLPGGNSLGLANSLKLKVEL